MDFKFADHHLTKSHPNGDHAKPTGGKAVQIVEATARDMASQFNKLYQLIEQLSQEELAIREQMKKNCDELRDETDEMDSKQRKFKEVIEKLKTL